jgi:hypothetical protein
LRLTAMALPKANPSSDRTIADAVFKVLSFSLTNLKTQIHEGLPIVRPAVFVPRTFTVRK